VRLLVVESHLSVMPRYACRTPNRTGHLRRRWWRWVHRQIRLCMHGRHEARISFRRQFDVDAAAPRCLGHGAYSGGM
jgi:hypothetical protein